MSDSQTDVQAGLPSSPPAARGRGAEVSAGAATRPRLVLDTGRRQIVLRAGGLALRWDARRLAVSWLLMLLVVVVAIAALATGDFRLSPSEVVSALLGGSEDELARTVVWDWRMPRVLSAIVFGAALGASGAVFQTLTRNPLASPDVMGFSTGAYTGALIVLISTSGGFLLLAAGSFIGGLAAAALVYLLAYKAGMQGFRMILVGIAISAVLGSVNTWLMLRADLQVAMSATAWGAGSIAGVTWPQVVGSSVLIVVFGALLLPLLRPLRGLEVGPDAAGSLGIGVQRSQAAVIVVAVGLTAAATAVAGPIMFIALVAPQVGARLAGTRTVSVGVSACLGALLLAVSDFVALHALGDEVMPVGVVTVTLGGFYLAWLLIRETRRRTQM